MSLTPLRRATLAAAPTAMLAAMLTAQPVPAHAATITTNVPAGEQLIVQGETPSSSGVTYVLATLNVTTSNVNEVRNLSGSIPIQHTRSGTEPLPDRFYHQASVRCVGADAPGAITGTTNLLANDTMNLTPRTLITFSSAGSYTCELRYKLTTSAVYDDTTDDVVTLSGGYVSLTDPKSAWSEQCYWPTTISQQPAQCDVSGISEVASVKIDLGQTATRRTPVRVVLPANTEFAVHADAALTGCGGTGGNEGLCGTDEGSFIPSTVSGQIRIFPQDSGDAYCPPTPMGGQGGTASMDIAVKTHHAVLYNSGRWTTSSDPACATEYVITNEISVTSGAPVIMHRNGSLLGMMSS